MEVYLALLSIQPARPLHVVPYAILELHSLIHLILQPTSSPSVLVMCSPTSILTPLYLCPCGYPMLEYLFPSSPSGELPLILQGQPKCHLPWEAFPTSEEGWVISSWTPTAFVLTSSDTGSTPVLDCESFEGRDRPSITALQSLCRTWQCQRHTEGVGRKPGF